MDNLEPVVDRSEDLGQLTENIISNISSHDEKRFHHILKLILQYFSFDTGTLHVFNQDDQHLYLVAASEGIPEHIFEKIQRIPLGKGIAGTAAATQKPVSICNLQTESNIFVPPKAKEMGIQGSLCIPLLKNDKVMGTLGVAWKGNRDSTKLEQTHLLSIGHLLAKSL